MIRYLAERQDEVWARSKCWRNYVLNKPSRYLWYCQISASTDWHDLYSVQGVNRRSMVLL